MDPTTTSDEGHVPTCCKVCQDLRPDADALYYNGNAFAVQSDVIKSAKNGCAGCSVLAVVLAPYLRRCKKTHKKNKCTWRYCNEQDTLAIRLSCGSSLTSPYVPATVQLYTLTEYTCPWSSLKHTRAVSRDTGSDTALNLLSTWIKDCAEAHPTCNYYLGSSRLPNRVVEIFGPERVRLRETLNEAEHYVCLSYCWGDEEPPKTTRDNLELHKELIPWDKLTQMFKQAIGLVHRLRIRYLWIDSLCILQGDLDDWRLEGSNMYKIYSQAYLTIAVTHSKSSTGGCFKVSDYRAGETYTFQTAEGRPYEVHAREPLAHINDYQIVDEHEHAFPLLKRGWAYQERMLSPRMVHFAPNELLWECATTKNCECSHWPGYGAGPNEWYRKDMPLYFEKPHMRMNNTPREFGSLSITSPVAWKWRRVVEQYTTRRLTKEEDIFPALQGVAKFMEKKCEYYAGLWNDDSLFINLLWHGRSRPEFDIFLHACSGRRGKDYGRRPAVWRAPTWSWASTTRSVVFTTPQDGGITVLASITDIGTDPIEDPFGQLRSGWLQLKGRCVDARLKNRASRQTTGTIPTARSDPSSQPEISIRNRFPYLQILQAGKSLFRRRTGIIPAAASGPSSQPEISTRNRFPYLQILRAGKPSLDPAEHEDDVEEQYSFEPDYNPDALFGGVVRLMEMLQYQKQEPKSGFPAMPVREEHYVYLVFVCKDETQQVYERVGFLKTWRGVNPNCFVNNGKEVVLNVI